MVTVKASSPWCKSATLSPFAHTVYLVPGTRSGTSRLRETESVVTLRMVALGGTGTSTPRILTRSSTGTSRIFRSLHSSLGVENREQCQSQGTRWAVWVRLKVRVWITYQLSETNMRTTFSDETPANGLALKKRMSAKYALS